MIVTYTEKNKETNKFRGQHMNTTMETLIISLLISNFFST